MIFQLVLLQFGFSVFSFNTTLMRDLARRKAEANLLKEMMRTTDIVTSATSIDICLNQEAREAISQLAEIDVTFESETSIQPSIRPKFDKQIDETTCGRIPTIGLQVSGRNNIVTWAYLRLLLKVHYTTLHYITITINMVPTSTYIILTHSSLRIFCNPLFMTELWN
jgi:hypothetical protein